MHGFFAISLFWMVSMSLLRPASKSLINDVLTFDLPPEVSRFPLCFPSHCNMYLFTVDDDFVNWSCGDDSVAIFPVELSHHLPACYWHLCLWSVLLASFYFDSII